jgi:hypothetical protein
VGFSEKDPSGDRSHYRGLAAAGASGPILPAIETLNKIRPTPCQPTNLGQSGLHPDNATIYLSSLEKTIA